MFILICLCLLLQRTAALSCNNGCTPTQLKNAGCSVSFVDVIVGGAIVGRAASRIRCNSQQYNPSLEGVLYITNTEHLVELIIEGQEITLIDPRTYKLANTTLRRVNVRNNKLTDPTPLVGMGEWCSRVYSLIMDNNPFTTFPARTALNLPRLPNATQERDPYNLHSSSSWWPAFGFCFSDGCLWQEINLQAIDDNADNDENPTKGMKFYYRTGFVGELNILNLPSTLTEMNIEKEGSNKLLEITAIAPSTFGITSTERSRWTDLYIQVGLKSIAVDLFTGLTNLKTLQIARTELTALPASLFDTNTKLETLYLQNNVLSSISANQFEKNVLLECKLFLF